jgi:peptidoglycan hydrolase-like protein with peptidoglycan-binding domain
MSLSRRWFAVLALLGCALVVPNSAAAVEPLAGPTAAQLKAKIAQCGTQLSNGLYAHDAGGSRTVPVCGKSGGVFWTADMDIDCDGQRTTQCNENTDPWFQPETACVQSNGQPLNSAGLPFIVVPLASSTWDYRTAGVGCGTVAAVVYGDRVAYAVVGDLGPAGAIGEGSYELAEQLGINPDPRVGGVSGAVVSYILFPDVKISPIEDAARARTQGETAASAFVASTGACDSVSLNFSAYSTIRNGSTGGLVSAAQCLLRSAGSDPGVYDGTFGASTEQAVRSFQTSKSLTADGVVGSRTWTALLSAGTTPTLQQGSTGEAVRRLQRALTSALARTVSIDGNFGPLTKQAVIDYQSSRGLGADGIVGAQTWGALQGGR